LVGAVSLTNGVASAAKVPATAPTITCKTLTATITWTPALVAGTKTSNDTQIKFIKPAVSGCTTVPKSAVTAATSVTATASLTTHGNSCISLLHSTGTPTTYTFKVKWKGGGSSTVVFHGSSVISSPSEGFKLSAGVATGSYPSTAARVEVFPNSAGVSNITKCVADVSGTKVSSVTIKSGSFIA
jgi:hypothetical protein